MMMSLAEAHEMCNRVPYDREGMYKKQDFVTLLTK